MEGWRYWLVLFGTIYLLGAIVAFAGATIMKKGQREAIKFALAWPWVLIKTLWHEATR